jgi:DME family drug/metabolite transporter
VKIVEQFCAVARTQVLIAAVLFGTTGTAQVLGPAMDPLAVGSSRIVVGAVLLAAVALVARGRRVPRRGAGLVLAGGACVAAYQASFFAAVADTGVAVGTVVALGSAPAFTGLLSRLTGGEPLARRWFAATGLACAGVALLTLGGTAGTAEGHASAAGIGLALAAGAGYAGYAVIAQRLLDDGAAPVQVMAAIFTVGALMLAPALVIADTGNLLTADGLTLALYLGALPTALAYILFARGLERIGASETATLTLAEPVTAMALGVVVLGERPGLAAVGGAALVMGGLAVLAAAQSPSTGADAAGRVPRIWPRPRQRSEPRSGPRPIPRPTPSRSASA